MAVEFVKNAVGRMVPTEINGTPVVPFMGVGQYKPTGRRYAPLIPTSADYPDDGNKLLPDLKSALIKAGIKDGMTISTHHHFRYGDLLANELFRVIGELGVKDLVWFPSAAFPCHEPIIKYLEDGTIHHIEGSMNGPLGRFTSQGRMNIKASIYADDFSPLDPNCECYVCKNFSRAYLRHIFRMGEISSLIYNSYHNLFFMKSFLNEIRESIERDDFMKVCKKWEVVYKLT